MDPKKSIKKAGRVLLVIIIIYWLALLVNWFVLPPKGFPSPYSLTIEPGQSLFSISKELSGDGVIRSRRTFEMLMLTFGSDKTISRGEYYFERPASVLGVAMRISGRDFGVSRQKVTLPEGFTNKQILERLKKDLHNFDSGLFLKLTKEKEGYLFPDTYHFMPWATADVVVNTLSKTFDKKIEPLQKEIAASKYSLKEIIIMASLIEKEANGAEDSSIISGILWKRIEMGIPLQVDAPFLYILGKESSELTRSDLATDSPFNTYKYKGLPLAPIGNPGLASIEAALKPKDSPYLYYLHDNEGGIHYAKTFIEHKNNIRRYLK